VLACPHYSGAPPISSWIFVPANLIVATGHNNLAINHSVGQVARHFIHGNEMKEGMLNRVSAVVHAYDPCLSCSTHADGTLALEIALRGPGGRGAGPHRLSWLTATVHSNSAVWRQFPLSPHQCQNPPWSLQAFVTAAYSERRTGYYMELLRAILCGECGRLAGASRQAGGETTC
jgi:hypothetical protein